MHSLYILTSLYASSTVLFPAIALFSNGNGTRKAGIISKKDPGIISQRLGMVKNINKANSGLEVYIGISMQFRKSEHICYYKPSISVDLEIVFKYQLLFQPYLCEGQCLERLYYGTQ